MGGTPKKKQTDYSLAGYRISNASVPYYQNTMDKLNYYIQNPLESTNQILNTFYDNTTAQSDFMRDYKRAMSNVSANNYASTGGGYSSSGQKAFNDAQRGWNDYGARLWDAGVQSSANMQNQFYNQALAGINAFDTAYKTGKEYSDIDQYNYMADQANSFWNRAMGIGGNLMQGAGAALMFVPGVGQVAGAGLMAGGKALDSMSMKPSDVYAAMGYNNSTGNQSGWGESIGSKLGQNIQKLNEAGYDWLGRKINTNNNATNTVANAVANAANNSSSTSSSPWMSAINSFIQN